MANNGEGSSTTKDAPIRKAGRSLSSLVQRRCPERTSITWELSGNGGMAPEGTVFFSSTVPGPSTTHGEFSNFYRKKFTDDDGRVWAAAEVRFQAGKAVLAENQEWFEEIAACKDPNDAKTMGSNVRMDTKTWDQAWARDIMADTLFFKFRNDARLRKLLLETGDKLIVEARIDYVWGSGMSAAETKKTPVKEWKGMNYLGEELMILRAYFSHEDSHKKGLTASGVAQETTSGNGTAQNDVKVGAGDVGASGNTGKSRRKGKESGDVAKTQEVDSVSGAGENVIETERQRVSREALERKAMLAEARREKSRLAAQNRRKQKKLQKDSSISKKD
ncbi:hypothetical protein ACHAP3_011117 [Botrytis cinerea]